jgi:hypothetical protein
MEKIKNMQQLQSKKKEIEMQQKALLEKIHNNWIQLKDNLKPVNIAKETFGKIMPPKPVEPSNTEDALKNSFTYTIALLAEKLADKAIEKVRKIFKK